MRACAKRQVEELTDRSAQDFDEFYAARLHEPEATDDLLVLSFDGKGIAMRHDDLREATRKAAEATPRTLHSRLAKGEKPNRKRMAQVTAIYSLPLWRRTIADVLHGLHDPKECNAKRPRPINKRVGRASNTARSRSSTTRSPRASRRDPERKRRWVVLVDGQPDQIKRVQRAARNAGVEITIQLESFTCSNICGVRHTPSHSESSSEAEKWVEDRLLALLGRSAGDIAKSLRGLIVRHDLDAKAAKPVVKCASYLLKNARWLHYDRALADGLPIATGVIEGACRHLVQDRMDAPAHGGR